MNNHLPLGQAIPWAKLECPECKSSEEIYRSHGVFVITHQDFGARVTMLFRCGKCGSCWEETYQGGNLEAAEA